MSSAFDWSPWLNDGEKILWKGKISIWGHIVFLALILGFFGAIYWWATAEIARNSNEVSCIGGSCQPVIGKERLVAAIVPSVAGILSLLTLVNIFADVKYAITNRRALQLGRTWGFRPNFLSVDLRDGSVFSSSFSLKLGRKIGLAIIIIPTLLIRNGQRAENIAKNAQFALNHSGEAAVE